VAAIRGTEQDALAYPTPRCPRYRSLDVWRGVACLLVLLFHATLYAGVGDRGAGDRWAWPALTVCRWGWCGVPIFFVISGYCISASADSARRRGRVRGYFVRRFRRIFPPLWLFLLLALVVVFVTERAAVPHLFADNHHPIADPGALTAWQWVGNLTLTESWRPHLTGEARHFFLGHTWSLCYEEQFYAVVGLLLLVARRRFFLGALLVTALVVVCRHVCWGLRLVPALDGFFLDGSWLMFAAGVLLYYQVNYCGRLGWWLATGALLLGVAYEARGYPAVETPPAIAFGFALVASLLHRWDGALSSHVALRAPAFCGGMCYSLYLVHWPVVKAISHAAQLLGLDAPLWTALVTVPACLAASIPLAWLFHRWVEKPFMDPPVPASPARQSAAGVTTPAALTTASGAAKRRQVTVPLTVQNVVACCPRPLRGPRPGCHLPPIQADS
jgi:peptidoglycan/LPS O-acetylase OafA/YrhL